MKTIEHPGQVGHLVFISGHAIDLFEGQGDMTGNEAIVFKKGDPLQYGSARQMTE